MTASLTRAIKLFGTDIPPAESRTLKAGALSAELEAGNLRYIRYGGVEVLRALSYVVRDAVWGTYAPVFSNMKIDEQADRFEVSYDAKCADDAQSISYSARIVGTADGKLFFEGEATALSDFSSNRVGFVTLHGPDGGDVEILHVDGSVEKSEFPKEVMPWQPFFDIRAMTHEPAPGLKVTCRMEGDTYETEDHRNWTDSSFKTYVRPLAAPAPFVTRANDKFSQSVSLEIVGPVPTSAGTSDQAQKIRIGEAAGMMPRIGLGVHPRRTASALAVGDALKALAPQVLVCHMDPGAGHGAEDLKRFKALGEQTDAGLALELIVPCEGDYRDELKSVGDVIAKSGIQFEAIAVAPGPDLIAGRPFSDWPSVPPLDDLYDQARKVFPGLPIGGGSFSFFTELNRRRPNPEKIDYLTHVTAAIVHAADDYSVIETLTAIPYVTDTARTIAPGLPYRVGPSAIGARHTPFGGDPTPNPEGNRVTMVRLDPRQRGLLGAAWYLGYIARMAEAGVDVLSMASPTGEFGVIHQQMEFPQVWFDEAGGVFPAYHVLRGAAQAAGQARHKVTLNNPDQIQAYAWRSDGKMTLWVANLTAQEQSVEIEGMPGLEGRIRVLDESAFEACAAGSDGFDGTANKAMTDKISLGAYAIAVLEAEI
ncbi:MAG: hypothetical protein HQ483_00430 [Rhodospirillales bacterium]|nr:hypothetical protein [Rhodospirillales bacterium]